MQEAILQGKPSAHDQGVLLAVPRPHARNIQRHGFQLAQCFSALHHPRARLPVDLTRRPTCDGLIGTLGDSTTLHVQKQPSMLPAAMTDMQPQTCGWR